MNNYKNITIILYLIILISCSNYKHIYHANNDLKQGDFLEAIHKYERILPKTKDFEKRADYLFLIAQSYRYLGQIDKSKEFFTKYLDESKKIHPNNKFLISYYLEKNAMSYFYLEDYKNAEIWIDKMILFNKKNKIEVVNNIYFYKELIQIHVSNP